MLEERRTGVPIESSSVDSFSVLPPRPLWPEGGLAGEDAADGRPHLTPYLPAGGTARGAIIVCPGGGYGRLAPHEGEPVARWLAGLGVAAFVLQYRVAPHRHPTPLGDARRAIRLVRQRAADWGLAAPRVGILGFSAGGHLAASVGVFPDPGRATSADPIERASCRPDALILGYPVISFGESRHQGSTDNLLGPGADEASREAVSVERHVGAATPPTFLWHTADDAAVPVEHSLLFAGALSRRGVPFALHVYPHGRHGLGLAEEDPVVGSWTGLCAIWLAERGFGIGSR
jgi:acetyl esterase/lipase